MSGDGQRSGCFRLVIIRCLVMANVLAVLGKASSGVW